MTKDQFKELMDEKREEILGAKGDGNHNVIIKVQRR